MALSTRHAPTISDPALQRIVQDIYDALNTIISHLNQQPQVGSPRPAEGRVGELRLTVGTDGKAFIEGKTKDGWVASDSLTFEKPKGQ